MSFLGTSSSAGTAITVLNELNDSVIVADFHTLGTCIDLYPTVGMSQVSMIGNGNYIDIRTENCGATPIILPPSWDASNRIYIDGVLQSP